MTERDNNSILTQEVSGATTEEKRPAIIKKAAPKKPEKRPGAGLPETVFIGGYRYKPVLEDEPEVKAAEPEEILPIEEPTPEVVETSEEAAAEELMAEEAAEEPAEELPEEVPEEEQEAAGAGFDDFSFAGDVPEAFAAAYAEIQREKMRNLDGFELPEIEDQVAFEDLEEIEAAEEQAPEIEELPEAEEPELIIEELPEEAPEAEPEAELPEAEAEPVAEEPMFSIHDVKQPSKARMVLSLIAVFLVFIVMTAAVAVTLEFDGKTLYQRAGEKFGFETLPEIEALADKVHEFRLAISDQQPAEEVLAEGDASEDEITEGDVTEGDAASHKVNIYYDGQKVSVDTDGTKTTAELLAAADIRVNDIDILTVPADAVPVPNSTVQVIRVREEQRQQEESTAFETIVMPSPLIREGEEETVGEGTPGVNLVTYTDVYHGGVFKETRVESIEVIEAPVPELKVLGDADASVSKVAHLSDVPLKDGIPESYEWVIDDATCTAYNYPDGCYGASGMYLKQGFVATDPDVIPYGTLMYIVGDNGFTYGWAVSADCGTAIFDGIIDIDCFFETYDESCFFGKKYLDVYVVKQLTQAELEDYMAHEGMFRQRVPE